MRALHRAWSSSCTLLILCAPYARSSSCELFTLALHRACSLSCVLLISLTPDHPQFFLYVCFPTFNVVCKCEWHGDNGCVGSIFINIVILDKNDLLMCNDEAQALFMSSEFVRKLQYLGRYGLCLSFTFK